ncbi:MAG: bifunctional DNA-formamidopyrimidine glycosylase/DNA-(apurinic or apyrimidinic site) lyase [Patescibacteria group bacterium]
MPELPEVETQVRDLQKIVGKRILELSSDTKKAFWPAFSAFRKKILGKHILAVNRRAKYVVFTLGLTPEISPIGVKDRLRGLTSVSKTQKLVVHFRMTGHFLLAKSAKALEKTVRHQFKLSHNTWLQFSDIRKFGTLVLCDNNSYEKICGITKLGPEPLAREFTLSKLRELLKSRKGMLKALLLDQSFIAGIGNIYADEICFGTQIHPASRVEKLSKQDVKNIFREIKKQLRKGIKNRGTTIGEYVDTQGKRGKNQFSLMAYKRHGKPCKVCGTKLRKMKIQQRTTTFCVKCQKKP